MFNFSVLLALTYVSSFFNRYIRGLFIIATLLLLILLSAFRGEHVGTDTLNYILHYQYAVSDSTWFRSSIEPGWYYLNKLSSLLGIGYRGAFLITITLVLSAIFFAARRFGDFKERLRKVKEGKAGLLEVLKGIGRLFITTEFAK